MRIYPISNANSTPLKNYKEVEWESMKKFNLNCFLNSPRDNVIRQFVTMTTTMNSKDAITTLQLDLL